MEKLVLRDDTSFVTGQLHIEIVNWNWLLDNVNNEHSHQVKDWISNKINIFDFFRQFQGVLHGRYIDALIPPPTIMNNYTNCKPHAEEVARHLEEGIRNGSVELLGRVGEYKPPHLVMPLVMVKGSRKSRLCHDERFLNAFMKHLPFSLEGLSVIPGLLASGDLIASSDEKSAYMGVQLTDESKHFFGLQFWGWYMCYTCLPFGWSASPFIYQTIGMQVTSFLRMKGIITCQYLDDRFLGPMSTNNTNKTHKTSMAIFFNAATLSSLGFTIARGKSSWYPKSEMKYLGFIAHTDSRYFEIPTDKKNGSNLLGRRS